MSVLFLSFDPTTEKVASDAGRLKKWYLWRLMMSCTRDRLPAKVITMSSCCVLLPVPGSSWGSLFWITLFRISNDWACEFLVIIWDGYGGVAMLITRDGWVIFKAEGIMLECSKPSKLIWGGGTVSIITVFFSPKAINRLSESRCAYRAISKHSYRLYSPPAFSIFAELFISNLSHALSCALISERLLLLSWRMKRLSLSDRNLSRFAQKVLMQRAHQRCVGDTFA
jgi:hypothetical protein